MNEERCQVEEDEINLLDCLLIILKRKRFILAVTAGITLLVVIISLIVPKSFKAESKILPPQQRQGIASQLISQMSGMAGLDLGGAAGIKNQNELYIGMLKSKPVLDAIIDRFKLMDLYKTKYREDARLSLVGQMKAQEEKKSGIITIAVEDRDPKRAADLANTFVQELKNLNKTLAVTDASQQRLFYEEQMKDVKESLLKAEEDMKGFMEKTGAIKIDDQARVVMLSISQIRAQIAAKEVQLRVMKTYATSHNPDIKRVEEEIRGLREQANHLEDRGGHGAEALMPTGRMPQAGADYLRRMREVKFNEALYEILLKQYEAAKLDEARDATVIQIIEKATPPEKKFKPKRAEMVTIAFVVSLFVSVFGAFFLEFIEKSKQNPENKKRLEQIKRLAIRGWSK